MFLGLCLYPLPAPYSLLMPCYRVSGALLSNESSFMTVIEDGTILTWCIETGASTSLVKSKRIPASVRFIHGEHLILIGGNGCADIVRAQSLYKTQTLWHVERQQTSTLSRSSSWRLSRQVLEYVDVPKVDFLAVSLYCFSKFPVISTTL